MSLAIDQGRPGRAVLLLLLCILLASFAASLVQGSGSVAVRTITLPTANGQWVAADLFKPASATSETPAPLVIVVPGFQRSKESLANIAIELARRGLVVIGLDPYAQGDSSSSFSAQSASKEGYGLFALVDYASDTNNLNYVDKQRIGVTGHSAGGNAAIQAASYYGKQVRKSGAQSKIHSVFVSGYVLTMTDAVLQHVRSNLGISYGLYDEGAFRNETQTADMRKAPEALRAVNSGLGNGAKVDAVEIDRYYGDAQQRTLRVVHNDPLLHPLQPYSRQDLAHQIAFFEHAFGLKTGLDPANQVWQWKELCTLVALLCALALLAPLARLLLQLPAFAGLICPIPEPSPRPRGLGRAVFWTVFLASGLIAGLTYIPLSEWSQEWFRAAHERQQTWFFPQRMNNALMLWAASNALVGFALFFGSTRLLRRASADPLPTQPVWIGVRDCARSLALALCLHAGFFGTLFFVYYLFHVDFRFVFLGARPFRPELLLLLPMYLPAFFLFFLQNSLRVNAGMRHQGVPEWRSILLAGFANTFGLILILALQYGWLAANGVVYWHETDTGWLYINLLFAVVPIMFALPWFHRVFFRMTGRIWLGPMVTSLVFVTMLLANTVCYYPV
jgi:hypothetical protein